jgi:crotonobetainyl-CoA:carnitine CoA-transferase CaiB-like acyl-CoA transferase
VQDVSRHGDGGPLSGIRVLEVTTMITGPLAGMMLADWGADVIKVENPDGGDPFRSFRGGHYSPHFCAYNRNKRSAAVDLQSEEGRAIFARLVAHSDVLLENLRPGVLDRLGFPDARLQALNARLVRCGITGFGPDGPYAKRPAYDAIAQALSGMASLFLEPDEPDVTGPTIGDNVTAHYACQGILAALFARERGEPARRIDVNMLESTIAFMPDPFAYYTQMGLVSDPHLRAHTSQSYAFLCADGRTLMLHLSSQQKFWERFVAALGRPDLLADPRFESRASRIAHYDDLRGLVAPDIAKRPRSHWVSVFVDADVPAAPVYDVTEVFDDPQVRHLETFADLHHARMGTVRTIRRPSYVDGARTDQPLRAPPVLGEHTGEILAELDALCARRTGTPASMRGP